MNDRDNLINLLRKKGYERMPINFNMSPELKDNLKKYCDAKGIKYPWKLSPYVCLAPSVKTVKPSVADYAEYYPEGTFKRAVKYDDYGVALEDGSEDCKHLKRFHHPLANAMTIEEIEKYPFPKYSDKPHPINKLHTLIAKLRGKFLFGSMEMTIFEASWYIRGMENLMMDMMCEEDMANAILDRVTENSIAKAVAFAKAGADGIGLGDDIGMQSTLIMSEDLYVKFIKPRLKKVIDAARAVKPDIIVFYHSCGYVEPFIPHLIEAGVDVLNPVQPECMNARDICDKFSDKISFSGGLGTQTLMPFGTAEEVKAETLGLIKHAGDKGGFWVMPTHMLEPEVPPENVIAYVDACLNCKKK